MSHGRYGPESFEKGESVLVPRQMWSRRLSRLVAVSAYLGFCLWMLVPYIAAQVPDAPSETFTPKASEKYQRELNPDLRQYPVTDPQKEYALFELIDLAEEQNPRSRQSWERLKQQAAAVGLARSSLYPSVSVEAPMSEARAFLVFPFVLGPVLGGSTLREDLTTFNPVLALSYMLFDGGARRGGIDSAKAGLSISGAALNDVHEQIALDVTTNFYKVLSNRGLVDAAQSSLKDATSTEEQLRDQMDHGLATLPNYLSAKSLRQQAEYNLENATGMQETATSDLARSVGLNPVAPLAVRDIPVLPQRDALETSVDELIRRALQTRPDLLEAVGRIRAADAEIKIARSALYPSVKVQVQSGEDLLRTTTSAGAAPFVHQGDFGGTLSLSWTLFDAHKRKYQIIAATAVKQAAQAQLAAAQDQVTNQVWSSYVACKVAFRRLETSEALLTSAQSSYDASKASYDQGLDTYIDLVNAEQVLAQARNERVQAETQVMSDLAQLAYQSGDLLGSRFLKADKDAK